MNKTIDINLFGFLFHIDEEAYSKLQSYLGAVEKSLNNEIGKSEIMSDIESRIAELFFEKQVFKNQVINEGMVSEVISIMGEPKDYEVDENDSKNQDTYTSHKETHNTDSPKKLYRDPNDAYAGGVSSGLGHYFNIDTFWVRLAWVLLTIFSSGTFIFIYFGFWFFVQKAKTTTQQLEMKGQAINLNNIEQEVRTEEVNTQRISTTFFENTGEIIKKLLSFLLKIFGAFLIFISSATILGILIVLIAIFVFKAGNANWYDILEVSNIGIPYELISIPIVLLFGIPIFFMGLLGFRILFNNIKTINKTLTFSLIGAWVFSGLILVFFIKKEKNERSQQAFVHNTTELPFNISDTLHINAISHLASNQATNFNILNSFNNSSFSVDQIGDEKKIVLRKTHLYIKPSSDEKVYLKISKLGKGANFDDAKANAKAIKYDYTVLQNRLTLSKEAITNLENEWKGQQLYLNLFIPEGMTVIADASTKRLNRNAWDEATSLNHKEGKAVTMRNKLLSCISCDSSETLYEEDKGNYINNNGINLNFNDGNDTFHIKVDENGVRIKGKSDNENFNLKIDDNGVEINGKQQ